MLFDGVRTKINKPLLSNESEYIDMDIFMPEMLKQGETYIVRITAVAEDCFWFDSLSENNVFDLKVLII